MRQTSFTVDDGERHVFPPMSPDAALSVRLECQLVSRGLRKHASHGSSTYPPLACHYPRGRQETLWTMEDSRRTLDLELL